MREKSLATKAEREEYERKQSALQAEGGLLPSVASFRHVLHNNCQVWQGDWETSSMIVDDIIPLDHSAAAWSNVSGFMYNLRDLH